jgi:dephospho-CoA kinase
MRYFTFSGPIGSGKSSVSKLFASTAGAGWSGFGATVKEIALERHLPISREDLQVLGANLVEKECSSFCRRVIFKAREGQQGASVIDGLRHIRVLKELRSIVGCDPLVCVYVDAPQPLRLERVKARDGVSHEKLAELEKHSTEIEVNNRLKEVADFVANNGGSVEDCVASIVQWSRTLSPI